MANIVDKLETEAQHFMAKRKTIENRRKEEMLYYLQKMYREIFIQIKSSENISISYIPAFVVNELKPIIEKYKKEQQLYADSFIRDDFNVGINTAQKFLNMANVNIYQNNNEIKDSDYQEVLVALLLYGQRLIDSVHEDLTNNLVKDMTSIYIANNRSYSNRREVDTENNSTVNTILAGSIIGQYINSTFKNINNRTGMIAQNETNRSLNHGLLMTYLITKRNFLPDLAVKWVEVKDEKLCQYCRDAANGGDFANGVYAINDIDPPPLHSRCRCILIPFSSRWEGMED